MRAILVKYQCVQCEKDILRSTILSLDFEPLKLPPLSLFWEALLATLAADNRRNNTGEDEAEELLSGGGKWYKLDSLPPPWTLKSFRGNDGFSKTDLIWMLPGRTQLPSLTFLFSKSFVVLSQSEDARVVFGKLGPWAPSQKLFVYIRQIFYRCFHLAICY